MVIIKSMIVLLFSETGLITFVYFFANKCRPGFTLAGIQQFNKPYPPIGLHTKFKFFHKLRLIDSELATCYTAAMKNYCR